MGSSSNLVAKINAIKTAARMNKCFIIGIDQSVRVEEREWGSEMREKLWRFRKNEKKREEYLPQTSLKGEKPTKIEEATCNEIGKSSGNLILQSGGNYTKVVKE